MLVAAGAAAVNLITWHKLSVPYDVRNSHGQAVSGNTTEFPAQES